MEINKLEANLKQEIEDENLSLAYKIVCSFGLMVLVLNASGIKKTEPSVIHSTIFITTLAYIGDLVFRKHK